MPLFCFFFFFVCVDCCPSFKRLFLPKHTATVHRIFHSVHKKIIQTILFTCLSQEGGVLSFRFISYFVCKGFLNFDNYIVIKFNKLALDKKRKLAGTVKEIRIYRKYTAQFSTWLKEVEILISNLNDSYLCSCVCKLQTYSTFLCTFYISVLPLLLKCSQPASVSLDVGTLSNVSLYNMHSHFLLFHANDQHCSDKSVQ